MNTWHQREQAQVLPSTGGRKPVEIGRSHPPPELSWCVDYAWWVRWDVPEPTVQEIIPRPVVHLAVEPWEGRPRIVVTGVHRRRFERELRGVGRTIAVAFRPGGFRPLVDRPMRALVDVSTPLDDLSPGAERVFDIEAIEQGSDDHVAAERLLAGLHRLLPAPDPTVAEIAGLVETVEHDQSIVRAEQLAALAGVSSRTLQRRFSEYIGVSPGWVVRRQRLLDVAAAAHGTEAVDWASVAVELGYSDQSHLIRTFRTFVGDPPEQHRRAAGTTVR